MDKTELENWQRVKDALEAAGKTDCLYYSRAAAICAGSPDPLPPVEIKHKDD